MRRIVLLAVTLLLGLGILAEGAWASQPDAATKLVQDVSQRMLSTLEKRRADVERDPSLIFGLVDQIVVPHFDFEKITQSAVGQHWKDASSEQRKALANGFREVLIRTYAKALLNYSGQDIRYLPVKPGQREATVTVPTEVRERGGPVVPVDYRMYEKNGKWLVYDLVIDNVSLIANYRSSFNTEIRRDGIDGLIRRLGQMNQKGEV
ncbi:MAG: ABC transporter substrate-binding protein [Chromatiaceae bacterium]